MAPKTHHGHAMMCSADGGGGGGGPPKRPRKPSGEAYPAAEQRKDLTGPQPQLREDEAVATIVPVPVALTWKTIFKLTGSSIVALVILASIGLYGYHKINVHMENHAIHTAPGSHEKLEAQIHGVKQEVQVKAREIKVEQREQIQKLGNALRQEQRKGLQDLGQQLRREIRKASRNP